jgi:hypothetical protein
MRRSFVGRGSAKLSVTGRRRYKAGDGSIIALAIQARCSVLLTFEKKLTIRADLKTGHCVFQIRPLKRDEIRFVHIQSLPSSLRIL